MPETEHIYTACKGLVNTAGSTRNARPSNVEKHAVGSVVLKVNDQRLFSSQGQTAVLSRELNEYQSEHLGLLREGKVHRRMY